MPFIGIVSKKSKFDISNTVYQNMANNMKKTYILTCIDENIIYDEGTNYILNLNGENIENIKNIKLDVVLIISEDMEFLKNEAIHNQIVNCKYLIINNDIPSNLELAYALNNIILTYGFNLKSTITTSSIDEFSGNIIVCTQRNIETINDFTIEPQEINISTNNMNDITTNDAYSIMAVVTCMLIFGITNIKILNQNT